MGYCVLHCKKGKDSGGGLGNHIDRTEGKEYSYRHADKSRLGLNEDFALEKFKNLSMPDAIDFRIKEGYTGLTAIRKDAVKFVETIFSGSHDDMIEIQSDPEVFSLWKGKTIEFAKSIFGEENIVRMSLHLDEETPHFHCVSVPIVDGALSAKKLLTRQSLADFQTKYAAEMSEFGLIRGELGSEAVHDGLTEYNSKQSQQNRHDRSNISIDYVNLDLKKDAIAKYKSELDKKEKELEALKKQLEKEINSKTGVLSNLKQEVEQIEGKLGNRLDYQIKTAVRSAYSLQADMATDFARSKDYIMKFAEFRQTHPKNEEFKKLFDAQKLETERKRLAEIAERRQNKRGGPSR